MRVVNSDLFYGERGRMGRAQKGARGGGVHEIMLQDEANGG